VAKKNESEEAVTKQGELSVVRENDKKGSLLVVVLNQRDDLVEAENVLLVIMSVGLKRLVVVMQGEGKKDVHSYVALAMPPEDESPVTSMLPVKRGSVESNKI